VLVIFVVIVLGATAAWPQSPGLPQDGVLSPLRNVLAALLGFLHFVCGSWAAAIVMVALLFRLFLFPISRYSMRHQAMVFEKQRLIKPLVCEIKRIYADDTIQRNEEILRVYRENGLNVISQTKGLLSILIQIPILLALYQLMRFSEHIGREPFLWMHDLTLPDSYWSWGLSLPWFGSHLNVLPLAVFVAQLSIAQGLSGYAGCSGRWFSKSMLAVPTVMLLLFYPLPAGCMLYWTTSSLCQAIEQRLSR